MTRTLFAAPVAGLLAALLLAGCGDTDDDTSTRPSADTSTGASPDSTDGTDGTDGTAAVEQVYAAWSAALAAGDFEAFRDVVRDDFFSDLASGDTLRETFDNLVGAIEEGILTVPSEPDELTVGIREVGAPDGFLEEAGADDVALAVLAGADDGTDVRVILLQDDGDWSVFGIEPS